MKTIEAPGKQETIAQWARQYGDELYSWAYHKTSARTLAEDLVQDTFMAALQTFNKFKGNSSPKTWLFSILNHKLIDYYRKKSRSHFALYELKPEGDLLSKLFDQNGSWVKAHRPQAWQQDDAHLLDNQAFKQTLESCMQKLPPSGHTAIQLKYLKEKDGKDICQALGISTSNYWQILHRAKLQLRHCLEHHWFKN